MGRSKELLRGTTAAWLLWLGLFWTAAQVHASETAADTATVLENSTIIAAAQDVPKVDEASSLPENHNNAHSLAQQLSTMASTVISTENPSTSRRRFVLRGNNKHSTSSTPPTTTSTSSYNANRSRKRHNPVTVSSTKAAPVLEFGQKLIVSATRNSFNEFKSTITTPSAATKAQNNNSNEPASSTTPSPTTTTNAPLANTSKIIESTLPPPSTSTISKHQFSAKILPASTSFVQTTPSTRVHSSESYNDIVALRRRRKKILRRMPAADVISEGNASSSDPVMNAALVRRKTLFTPQRNGSSVQASVVRRPLLRLPTIVANADEAEDVIRKMLTTFLPSNNNYTTSTRVITLEGISNKTGVQNSTVEETIKEITTLSPTTGIKIESTTSTTRRPISLSTTTTSASSSTSTTTTRAPITTRKSYTSTSTEKTTTKVRPQVVYKTEGVSFASGRPVPTNASRPFLGATHNTVGQGGHNESSVGLISYVLFSLGVVALIGAVSYAARHLANKRRRMLDESDSSYSGDSSMAGVTLSRPSPKGEGGILSRIQQVWPTDKGPLSTPIQHPEWHFPRHKLRLQTVLGQGNFGQVWKAEAEDICGITGTRLVAVKSTKAGAGEREKSDLLRELAIMQQLGSHPNVVTLLGCCTEQEPHLLIMEYVMYGKLLAFLRDHRTRRDFLQFSSSDDDGGEQALTSWDLTHFAYCIAKGMEYLVSRGIIHRDLAARNILVDHNKQCKIADFGMSRHARDSSGEVYEPKQKGALPIRWMAPESLEKSIFTHRSDVWSFGITMWEIVTLGSTPYSTMGAREVMRKVRDGYRLERPLHCRPELFRVIASCWISDPYLRPDFAQLRTELRRLQDEDIACPAGGHIDVQAANPPPPSSASTLMANSTGHLLSDPGGM
ncbi:tyrosine kinase receptor Cad96Ca-like [Neocloeon triangulifer]|uniref:tyrosine kinase receptor Cad96Ca-like n=1 Tax=Neocloeon triangulifer TaxID=2078957 RepID=UPI00286F1082|nr:tyrosine kinase receptor Cad96Ca-like [Neocloeon triangulifer]